MITDYIPRPRRSLPKNEYPSYSEAQFLPRQVISTAAQRLLEASPTAMGWMQSAAEQDFREQFEGAESKEFFEAFGRDKSIWSKGLKF